jgi:hypothetical protein
MAKIASKLSLWGCVLLVFIWFSFWLGCRLLLDGPAGVFGALMVPSATFYAEGYSDFRFLRVRVGMTVLGEPIKRYPVKESRLTAWRYSGWEKYDNRHVRVVLFEEGVVREVLHEFHVYPPSPTSTTTFPLTSSGSKKKMC